MDASLLDLVMIRILLLQAVQFSLSLGDRPTAQQCLSHGHVFSVGRLETRPLKVVKSKNALQCLGTCLETDDCISFNFCESSIKGIWNCELLDQTVCDGCPLSRPVTCWKHYVIGCLNKVQESNAVAAYQSCYNAAFCPPGCDDWSLAGRRSKTPSTQKTCLYDHTGTSFVTCFMRNSLTMNTFLFGVLISSYSDVTVTYTIAAPRNNPGLLIAGTIDPYQTTKVDLTTALEPVDSPLFEDKGISIETSGLVSVIGYNERQGSMSLFTVMPRDALGRGYDLITWQFAAFLLAATEDQTHVTLDLSQSDALLIYNGIQYQHSVLSLDLQAYSTFYFSQFENIDESVIKIESDKPIVVQGWANFLTDDKSESLGLMVDQIAPISSYGKEYVLINALNAGLRSVFEVIGNDELVSFTVLTVNGEMNYTITGAGSTTSFRLNDACAYMVADKPVGVVMQADNPDDEQVGHAFMMVPPVDNWVDPPLVFATPENDVSPSPESDENDVSPTPEHDVSQNVTYELMLVVPARALTSLRMDDVTLDVNWEIVPGRPSHVFASYVISDGRHVITSTDGSWKIFAAVFRNDAEGGALYSLGQKYR